MAEEKRFIKYTVKDSVFSEIFTVPAYQVELLQALYPEQEDITVADIRDVTIKNVVSTDVYNDLGLLFRDTLVVLVEAQSTMTANILVRFIEYIARVYKDHIINTAQNWYDRAKVQIPRVDLYVVYVGAAEAGGNEGTINLTDEFFGGVPCGIDVRARVIRRPMGGDALSQYIRFSEISNAIIAAHGRTRESAELIVDSCIKQGILPEFFAERKKEVLSAMVELFSQEEAYQMMEAAKRSEGIAQGRREGMAQGRREGMAQGRREGELSALAALVADGVISLRLGAERAGVSETEFIAQAKSAYPGFSLPQ